MALLPKPPLLRDQKDFRVYLITVLIENNRFVMNPSDTSNSDTKVGDFVKINSYLFGIPNFLPDEAKEEREYQVITRKPISEYIYFDSDSGEE